MISARFQSLLLCIYGYTRLQNMQEAVHDGLCGFYGYHQHRQESVRRSRISRRQNNPTGCFRHKRFPLIELVYRTLLIRDTYGQDGANDTEVIELLWQVLIALDSIYTKNQSFPSLNCSLDCGGHSVADRVSALRENSFLH